MKFHVYAVHNIDTRGVTWNKLLHITFSKKVRTEITSKLSYAHLDKLRYRLEPSDSQTLLKKEMKVSLDHCRKILLVFQIWGDAASITRYGHNTRETKHRRSKIICVTVEYSSILPSNSRCGVALWRTAPVCRRKSNWDAQPEGISCLVAKGLNCVCHCCLMQNGG